MKLARRILGFLVVAATPLLLSTSGTTPEKSGSKQYLVFVGTYTAKTSSKGIYAFRYYANTGKLAPIGVAAETRDPSWVAIHPNGKFLYAVNEAGKNSMVSAFSLDAQSGKLTLLNQVPALGEDPCYLSFDRTGKYIFIANYTSGNVVVFPIEADGKLGAATANVRDTGVLGPDKERQDGPHAHWIGVTPANQFVRVADLGLDAILSYRFDATKGTLADTLATLMTDPGAGPRHFAFHPNGQLAYFLTEMQATVTALRFDSKNASLVSIQTVSTLPTGYAGPKEAAELLIHPSGRFLYASNRGGVDSITAFAINRDKGTLKLVGRFSTNGKSPRHFAIDPSGNFLLAEDQLSDKIVTFRIDQKTGALTATGDSVEVPSPVCMVFLPVESRD